MAESSEDSEDTKVIRSLNNDVTVKVQFFNRSGRKASLLWYNFKGVFVKYAILNDKDSIDMDTYETHPWGARDATTGDVLNIDGSAVFYPKSPVDEVQLHVYPAIYIDLPLYSLKEICLQQVRKLYPKRRIKTIEDVLPWTLLTDLTDGPKHEVHYLYKHLKVSIGSHADHVIDKDGLVKMVELDGKKYPMGDHRLDGEREEQVDIKSDEEEGEQLINSETESDGEDEEEINSENDDGEMEEHELENDGEIDEEVVDNGEKDETISSGQSSHSKKVSNCSIS